MNCSLRSAFQSSVNSLCVNFFQTFKQRNIQLNFTFSFIRLLLLQVFFDPFLWGAFFHPIPPRTNVFLSEQEDDLPAEVVSEG